MMVAARQARMPGWGSDPALPQPIAALWPQTVKAFVHEGYPVVDIQLTGGFSHRGLLVIVTNVPPEFMPRKAAWRIRKMGDQIFEYRE